jgi:tetratricopeptide (TPR) repeat protein
MRASRAVGVAGGLWLIAAAAVAAAQPTDPAAAPADEAPPAAAPAPAPAPPAATLPAPRDPRLALRRGLEAFEYGQYAKAVALLRPLVEEERLQGADRIQALRAYGVSLFLLGRRGGAEAAFLMLLREDPTARLDPALVPPEVIAFLDEVRARHQAVIQRAAKARRPSAWFNLLPPLGQFQNGHKGKAWLVLALEVTFLTIDITTYWVARSMPRSDGTVASEGKFNAIKTLNLVSFCLLAGTIVYGVVDGFYYHGVRERAAAGVVVLPAPLPGGAGVSLASRF